MHNGNPYEPDDDRCIAYDRGYTAYMRNGESLCSNAYDPKKSLPSYSAWFRGYMKAREDMTAPSSEDASRNE